MRVKIVSDGTPAGTRITDEDGNTLDYVQSIDWHSDAESLATATVRFVKVPVDVEGELHVESEPAGE